MPGEVECGSRLRRRAGRAKRGGGRGGGREERGQVLAPNHGTGKGTGCLSPRLSHKTCQVCFLELSLCSVQRTVSRWLTLLNWIVDIPPGRWMLFCCGECTKLAAGTLLYAAVGGRAWFYDADLGANIPTTGDIDFYCSPILASICHCWRWLSFSSVSTQPMKLYFKRNNTLKSFNISRWLR